MAICRSLWSWFFMITPYWSRRKLSSVCDHLSQQTLTQSNLYGIWSFVDQSSSITWRLYWQLRLFCRQSISRPSGQAFQASSYAASLFEKFRSGDLDAVHDRCGWHGDLRWRVTDDGVLFGGGLFAFIIPTMFFISWQLTLISFIPMIFLVVSTYFWVESRRSMLSKPRSGRSVERWSLESIEGSGSCGPIVDGSAGQTVSEENSQSPKQETNCSFSSSTLTLALLFFIGFRRSCCSCYLEASPWQAGSWALVNYWLYSCIWSF